MSDFSINTPEIYYQYKNADNTNTLLAGLLTLFKKYSFDNLQDFFNIDDATGLWLDQIGLYLNYQRQYYYENAFAYDDITSGYDDTNFGYDDLGSPLSDDVYRILLKAEIFRRNSKLTEEEIRQILKFSTSAYKVNLVSGIKQLSISLYFTTENLAWLTNKTNLISTRWFGLPTGVELVDFKTYYPTLISFDDIIPIGIMYFNNYVFASVANTSTYMLRFNLATNSYDITSGCYESSSSTMSKTIVNDGTYIYRLSIFGRLEKINPTTNAVISYYWLPPINEYTQSMCYANGYIWVCMQDITNVYKIRCSDMTLSATIDIGEGCDTTSDICYLSDAFGNYIWITAQNNIIAINTATNAIDYTYALQGGCMCLVEKDDTEGDVIWAWKRGTGERKIYVIDNGFTPAPITLSGNWTLPTGIIKIKSQDGYLWFGDRTNKKIYKMTTNYFIEKYYSLDRYFDDFTFEDDFLWLTNGVDKSITKIIYKDI